MQISKDRPLSAGFVGLGNIGLPMALRIARAGISLNVWARRSEILAKLTAEGARACASLREVGEASDIVGVCVRTDADVLDVVLAEGSGVLAGMRPGSVLLIHATVLPSTIDRIDEAARLAGVSLIDAPVSGGPKGAEEGNLTVLLGGDSKAIDLARPVLESFAANLPHCGKPGSAQLLKLVNNNLCYANVAMAIAALDLLAQLGVDPQAAAQIIATSSGASHGFGLVTSKASVEKMTGPTSNIAKDVAHLVQLLEERGLDSALTRLSGTTAQRVSDYAKAGAPAAL